VIRYAGLIAAGEGSRLAPSYPGVVKPLVPVGGRPLVHWVIEGLAGSGARRVTVLTNSRGGGIPPSLRAAFPDHDFDFVSADTASSYESFRLVSRRLAERAESFVVSTVDALIRPADLARFWDECLESRCDAGLGLTAHVDDEKPLWADVDELGFVVALGEKARSRRLVTSGVYFLTRAAAETIPAADAHPRLRDFWSALVDSGARVLGSTLSKTLDIDRPGDVLAAEAFLSEIKR
jgi:NDP-sugar pyrophosphorylase family protein